MNRAAFYAALRRSASGPFGKSLCKTQVQGIEAILDEAQRRGLSLLHLAAVFAEACHETGGAMQPVEENLNYAAKRLVQVWPGRFPTLASAEPYAGNPRKLAKRVYGGRLGNVNPDDGWLYRGRGLAQITGRANYVKFGLAETPDRASEMAVSVRILFDGMTQGLFTGHRLRDFHVADGPPGAAGGYRYAASRAIISGDVRQNGPKIEAYGRAFEGALRAAGYGATGIASAPGAVVLLRPDKIATKANGARARSFNRSFALGLTHILGSVVVIFRRWMK